MRKTHLIALSSALLMTACTTMAQTATSESVSICATAQQTAIVQDYVTNKRPGVPLAIPSRNLKIAEGLVASALPENTSVGVAATPELTKQIWKSIDAWGANTSVSLVFAPSSNHAFAFSSLVPIALPDEDDGYLDVYADNGDGIHSHIQLDHVASVWAHDLQKTDGTSRTRGVSLYGKDNHLILGVYASIKDDPFDDAAAKGFDKTWDVIAAMPQACQ